MNFQKSAAVRSAALDAEETSIGASPILRLYSGAAPANAAAASTGTLLAEGTLPADWMAAASGGVKTKSGTWTLTGLAGAGLGTDAGYWRLFQSDGTTCAYQGDAGYTPDGNWAASTAYVIGDRAANGGNVYQCITAGTSAASGGPSGTGSDITDGTAHWAYASVEASLGMLNTNIATGQSVTVSAFTLTAGNA